jgi:tetratricopeptide (TPR) repeat protein
MTLHSRIVLLVLAVAAAPAALAPARQAAPDRPVDPDRLGDLERKAAAISALGRGELLELAKSYEERNQPQRARDLKRRWLDDQRDRLLDATDVDGRIALARQYEALLGDTATAAELLRAALELDPESTDAASAFRNMGFRNVDGAWVAPETPRAAAEPTPGSAADWDDSLLGESREQVVAKLGGKPDQIARSASQGGILEQWIYRGPRNTQYINFLIQPGSPTARVVGRYSLP